MSNIKSNCIIFKQYIIHAVNGDKVTCRMTMDNRYVCPICGFLIAGKPPYSPDTNEPSFELCPCCEYQFGWDDKIGPGALAGSLQARWEELRERWLCSIANAEQITEQLGNLAQY